MLMAFEEDPVKFKVLKILYYFDLFTRFMRSNYSPLLNYRPKNLLGKFLNR